MRKTYATLMISSVHTLLGEKYYQEQTKMIAK